MENKHKVENWELTKRGIMCLTESGLNRIMRHGEHGFVIISANRGSVFSSNPNTDLTDELKEFLRNNKLENTPSNQEIFLKQRNKQAEEELVKDIRKADYAYTPVFGGYHGGDDVRDEFEPSYIVYNHNRGGAINYGDFEKLKTYAIEWCKKYKQDSVYIQEPGEAPVYLDCNGEQMNTSSSNDFKFNDDKQTYFTTAKREKRTTTNPNGLTDTPQRFTADIQFESMYYYRGASTYNDRMRRGKLGEIFLNS